MAEKLGIADRFFFLGYRDDIEEVYRSLDLLVVTSLGSEANCRVTLEAMSSGLPVVAARTGVIPLSVDSCQEQSSQWRIRFRYSRSPVSAR